MADGIIPALIFLEDSHMYAVVLHQFTEMLKSLDKQLTKAEAYAEERKFDVNNLIQARLFADQFPLVKQVQTACDNVKLCTARMTGTTAPKHEDNEATFPELHARIASTLAFVEETLKTADFSGVEAVEVRFPWLPGMHLSGPNYFHQFANIYFHLTTAYAILRANGVPLGKADFMGQVSFVPDQA
jgi:hypothetical protein